MRINLLTSFAAGLLISTTITGVVYFSGSDEQKASAKASEKVQLSEAEMKNKLESAGYVIQTKEEHEMNIKDSNSTEKKQEEPVEEKKEVTQVVVNVAEGMTSIDVGNTLVQAKLVTNAFEFSKYIESKGLQNKLRPGSYTVNSEMTLDEIIATIFK